MNRFYQGDWIDSMASRFIEELPEKFLEKNSFFDENKEEEYIFLGRTLNGKKDGPWIRWYKNKKVPEVVLIDIPEPQPRGTWSGGKEEIGAWKDGKKW